jgi:hypothetical protein
MGRRIASVCSGWYGAAGKFGLHRGWRRRHQRREKPAAETRCRHPNEDDTAAAARRGASCLPPRSGLLLATSEFLPPHGPPGAARRGKHSNILLCAPFVEIGRFCLEGASVLQWQAQDSLEHRFPASHGCGWGRRSRRDQHAPPERLLPPPESAPTQLDASLTRAPLAGV